MGNPVLRTALRLACTPGPPPGVAYGRLWAIKIPAESSKGHFGKRKDEAEARPLAGKADAYDAALTALREDTRHW